MDQARTGLVEELRTRVFLELEPTGPEAEATWLGLWESIVPGFRTLQDVLDEARDDIYHEDVPGLTPELAEIAVRRLWDFRLEQLAATGPGDDVAVMAALDEVRATGITVCPDTGVDKQDGGDCAQEAANENGDRGFVYFHMQDADRLAYPDAELYLGYDVLQPKENPFPSTAAWDRAGEELAGQLVDALRRRGLTVEWDGTFGTRPSVTGLTWNRPLPG